jgi:hypothetical protein
MAGLEQFEISYESRIDRCHLFIDGQIRVKNDKQHSHARLAFMQYSMDNGGCHCDIEIELKIGPVYLAALLSPNHSDTDRFMATVEQAFENCCRLIGRWPKNRGKVRTVSILPGDDLIPVN